MVCWWLSGNDGDDVSVAELRNGGGRVGGADGRQEVVESGDKLWLWVMLTHLDLLQVKFNINCPS